MTPDDVRAAAEQLVDFHERFAPLFGKEQAQDHAYDYLNGLMDWPGREPTRAVKGRRPEDHIPEGLPFRTKPRIAAELVRGVVVLGTVALDWVVADEEYGRAGHFLDELETLEQRYVLEVPVTTAVW